VLDHKPWSAEEGAPWLAAFPDMGHAGPSRLQVAPDIAVELPAAGPGVGDGRPRPARLVRAPLEAAAPDPPPPAPPAAAPRKRASRPARKTAELEAERDAALETVEAMRREKDAGRAEADRLRAELEGARQEAERAQTELGHARTDADRLRTELSHVRAEVNTLRQRHDQTHAKAEQLQAEVVGLRTDAQRSVSEHAELERLRRTPARPPSTPYIAPRPMAFRDQDPRPDWTTRVLAGFFVAGVLVVLVQLLFGVF
jgi:hypothetical protein